MIERIKSLRKDLGLTQEEFAKRIGVSRSALQAWNAGFNNPSNSTIRVICDEFRVRRDWLLTGEGDMYLPDRPEDVPQILADKYGRGSAVFRECIRTYMMLTESEQRKVDNFVRALAERIANENNAQSDDGMSVDAILPADRASDGESV